MEQLKTMEDENKVFSCIGGTFIWPEFLMSP